MHVIFFLIVAVVGALMWVFYFNHAAWQGIVALLVVFLAANLVYILFWGLVSLFVNVSKPISRQSRMCRTGCVGIATLALSYFGAKVHISGIELLPQDSRFLFVSNHRSGFDPLVAISRLKDYNISFISKPENMNLPIFGRLAYGAGYLAIDRENDRNALQTVNQAAEYIANNLCSIGIYPEGTRSRTKDVLPFRPGCFKIAQKANVPVVIAASHGTENVTKKGLFGGADIYLDILELVPAEKVQAMNTRSISEYSRNLIVKKLAESR